MDAAEGPSPAAATSGTTAPGTTGASPAPTGAAARPARNWTEVVQATPEGGFRVGNPDARVRLVEYASLTCPHCADFDAAAHEPLLNTYVATGEVSYELRNFVMNGPDLAATLLARCQGPTTFFRLTRDLFRTQADWIKKLQSLNEADQQRMQSLPPARQTMALAEAAGLDAFMRARGMGRVMFEQCLADEQAVDALSRIRQQAVEKDGLRGTPHFLLDGAPLAEVTTWEQLEPRLQAAVR